MQNFKKLRAWQLAADLAIDAYSLSRKLPRDERFDLIKQIRRSASSMPANVAEGRLRATDADFVRFLDHALGSSAELESHLYLAERLGYLLPTDTASIQPQIEILRRTISALIRSIHNAPSTHRPLQPAEGPSAHGPQLRESRAPSTARAQPLSRNRERSAIKAEG